MNFEQLRRALQHSPGSAFCMELPTGDRLPNHFHVTEVGKVTKDFVDCGGVRRLEQTCVLQTLVANDFDHRLSTDKLSMILDKSAALGLKESLEVDVEIQGTTSEIYRVGTVESRDGHLVLKLQNKETACLAPDQCGLEVVMLGGKSGCSGQSGCC